MQSAPLLGGEASVVVKSLAGELIAELSQVPSTARDLKVHISATHSCPPALQRLVGPDHRILADEEELFPAVAERGSLHLTFVVDESPLLTWDIQNNPNSEVLSGSGGDVFKAGARYDFVNIITVEPVRAGAHFFEFVMHRIGDEQWCGVTSSELRAGFRGDSKGWFYYCGRRHHEQGALHAGRERQLVQGKNFGHVKDGDVIGMLLDVDAGGVAFCLNGVVQGACVVPKAPLFLTTSLDDQEDHVELRKLPAAEAPSGAQEALETAVAEEELVQFVDSE